MKVLETIFDVIEQGLGVAFRLAHVPLVLSCTGSFHRYVSGSLVDVDREELGTALSGLSFSVLCCKEEKNMSR